MTSFVTPNNFSMSPSNFAPNFSSCKSRRKKPSVRNAVKTCWASIGSLARTLEREICGMEAIGMETGKGG